MLFSLHDSLEEKDLKRKISLTKEQLKESTRALRLAKKNSDNAWCTFVDADVDNIEGRDVISYLKLTYSELNKEYKSKEKETSKINNKLYMYKRQLKLGVL
jgi:hypothetical protein